MAQASGGLGGRAARRATEHAAFELILPRADSCPARRSGILCHGASPYRTALSRNLALRHA
jgi:hypothetical protein